MPDVLRQRPRIAVADPILTTRGPLRYRFGGVLVSLLIEGFAVLVVVKLVRLTRNWRRHRRQPRAAEPELVTRIGDTGKTDYSQSQTLSSQARTTTGI